MIEIGMLYTEINLFCLILLAIIWIKSSREDGAQMLGKQMLAMVFFIVSDNAAYLLQEEPALNPSALMLVKTIYFMSTTVMCYFWFLYFEGQWHLLPPERMRRVAMFSSGFIWIQLVCHILNFWNGMFFYVVPFDTQGAYVRGPWFTLQYFFAYFYILFAIARALHANLYKRNYVDRDKVTTLMLFPAFPALAGIIQFFYPQLPLACAAMTISILLLYMNAQEDLVCVDPLTQLNNRKRMMQMISKAMRDHEKRGWKWDTVSPDARW